MAGKQEAAATPSFCLPDLVEDLHHLLVDDEDDGHIQTHPAQARDCPFIETRGGCKEKKREYGDRGRDLLQGAMTGGGGAAKLVRS